MSGDGGGCQTLPHTYLIRWWLYVFAYSVSRDRNGRFTHESFLRVNRYYYVLWIVGLRVTLEDVGGYVVTIVIHVV